MCATKEQRPTLQVSSLHLHVCEVYDIFHRVRDTKQGKETRKLNTMLKRFVKLLLPQ